MMMLNMHSLTWISYLTLVVFLKPAQGTCDYQLTKDNGIIKSPRYPAQYPADSSCVWTITVAKGYYVKLKFFSFDVESYDGCKTDMLEIKDGGDKGSPLIDIFSSNSNIKRFKGGQYCNSRKPPDVITSTSNQLRLWFSSDSTIQYGGFKASFQAIKDEGCGKIEEIPGSLASPRFPFAYPNNMDCRWEIEAPQGRYILLEFTAFQLESSCTSSEGCKCNDYLSITDHSTDETIKYCMTSPEPMVSNGNRLTIRFHSDSYGRLKGFKASFSQSFTKLCGGDIFRENGVVESPDFNLLSDTSSYPPYSRCIWTVNTRKKNTYVSLRFQYFDVMGSVPSSCTPDRVVVRDGFNETSPLIGEYCNEYKPGVIVSTGESIFIKFESGNYSPRKGFRIFFRTHTKSCSSSLGIEDGRISKLNLDTSSSFKIAHWPHFLSADLGRLNGQYAWCSQEQKMKFIGEYFQVTFDKFTRVSSVATQGYTMVGNEYFVTKYKLKYSMTAKQLQYYVDGKGRDEQHLYTVFDGNVKFNQTKTNKLSPNIVTKLLRLIPLEFKSGRRKHICLRMEVYGCPIDEKIEVITDNSDRFLEVTSNKKISRTWLLAPSRENSVFIVKTLQMKSSHCSHSKLSYSFDGLKFSSPYCGDDDKAPSSLETSIGGVGSSTSLSNDASNAERFKEKIQIYPTTRQLWIQFDVMGSLLEEQNVNISYSTIYLGYGRIISSVYGKIRLMHSQVAKERLPTIWLFHFPKGYRIKLDFVDINLPDGFQKPSIVLKSGFEENSKVIRIMEGREGHWAFIHPRSVLRLEYHPGRGARTDMHISGDYGDGFTLEYTALKN